MKSVIFGLLLTIGMVNAQAGVPGRPVRPVLVALQVQFGDFGSGGSHRPQAAALALVAEAIQQSVVGKYVLKAVQHHGEISFCVQAPSGIRGMGGDLSELMEQLNQLQPKQGDMYSLSVQATADCN